MTEKSRLSGVALLIAMVSLKGCGGDAADALPTVLPPAAISVGLQEVGGGFDFPLYVTAPPADPRVFVVEKAGRIRIVKAGSTLPTPYLDISSEVSSGGEQGLLGLAFDPHYATTGRFYVDYTGSDGSTHIARFRVSSNPDLADRSTEELLLTIEQPYANHNGGEVTFGPDGYLYAGMGDGGSGGDPQHHGQSNADLLGSLLRLDVSGARGYAIPPTNPFVAASGARGELWNIGMRNPWRFSFDRSNGDLYIADVGQGAREEVDVSPASAGGGRGLNYGWNRMEGTACYEATTCDRTGLTLPVTEYTHSDGCSITGGYVYRGGAIPAMRGMYFYSDFCSGWVRSFRYAGGAATAAQEWPTLKTPGQVTSFGEDASGEIYITTGGGKVYRIVPR